MHIHNLNYHKQLSSEIMAKEIWSVSSSTCILCLCRFFWPRVIFPMAKKFFSQFQETKISKPLFVAVFLGCTSTGQVSYGFVVLCPRTPKAQLAVVLVLKCLRRGGNSLKSHPTDWEKLGIEPATPCLQDIGLSPTPQRLLKN